MIFTRRWWRWVIKFPNFCSNYHPSPYSFHFLAFLWLWRHFFSFLKADFWSEKNLYRMNTKWAEFKISTWIDSAISQAEPGLLPVHLKIRNLICLVVLRSENRSHFNCKDGRLNKSHMWITTDFKASLTDFLPILKRKFKRHTAMPGSRKEIRIKLSVRERSYSPVLLFTTCFTIGWR